MIGELDKRQKKMFNYDFPWDLIISPNELAYMCGVWFSHFNLFKNSVDIYIYTYNLQNIKDMKHINMF